MPAWSARGLLALSLLLPAPLARAQPGAGDVLIRVEERQLRAAGIELARVEPEDAPGEMTFPGTVVVPPSQLRVVAAPVGGLLEAMEVAEGEAVRAGQPIARLRSTELLEAQRLFLEALATDALSRERLSRDETLFRDRVIAERRLLTARAEAVHARTVLEEREQMLGLLGMGEAEATALRRTRRLTAMLTVVAPADGVVVGRQAVAGERVAAAAALVTVARLDPLWVNLQVPLARAGVLDTSTRVVVQGSGAEGRVLRVGRSADPATQSVNAVAEIDRDADRLRPGQAVTVSAALRRNGLPQWRVPSAGVVRHRERSWVFLRVPEGFRARPVTVLSEGAQVASIRGALAPRDQIVVRGVLSLLSELVLADGE